MKKTVIIAFLGLLLVGVSAFGVHKFYMAIFQVNYVPQKKMLQITSRIFVDDLNLALEKKYNKKVFFGTEKETAEDLVLLKKYFSEHLIFKINGQPKILTFLSKELDGDVLVCYCRIDAVAKLQTTEINNTFLTHWNPDQQNILHFTALGEKKSVLFTASKPIEMLNF